MSTRNSDTSPVEVKDVEIPGDEMSRLVVAALNFHLYLKRQCGPSADWAVWVKAESPEEYKRFEAYRAQFHSASEAVHQRMTG